MRGESLAVALFDRSGAGVSWLP